MKKQVDGRTRKGLRIREQAHESLLIAYIDLIRGGVPAPTARETAERAGFSLRAFFNHFPDVRALRLASFNRIQRESSEFFSEEIPDRGSAADRLELFVQRHTRRLEYVTPFHRTAAMVESIDRDVAEAMRQARNAAVRDLEKVLGATLTRFSRRESRELLTRLHIVCNWDAWEFLRSHYRLSPRQACAVLTSLALTILAAAERGVGLPRSAVTSSN